MEFIFDDQSFQILFYFLVELNIANSLDNKCQYIV